MSNPRGIVVDLLLVLDVVVLIDVVWVDVLNVSVVVVSG